MYRFWRSVSPTKSDAFSSVRPLLWRSIALVQWVQAASDASAVDVIRMFGAVQFTVVPYERVEVLYVPQAEYVLLAVPGAVAL